ncbi:Rhodanese-like domain-containing protein [Ephemerocybe angulata]|uniref:Rhodanese-like domain-containing protein n=1 Tax=Ephemerocybe angulata TaxID=980116 RepID=A0A8H6M9B0_9AGAR|nr:Rhodanese-like domain-containing protein [Tulosesus angulatus]
MTAEELAALMKSGEKVPSKDFLVVDVRDDDFAGGNIVGARNHPANKFMLSVPGLVKETKDLPLVVFHCALSQIRGPKAARIYEETRKNLFPDATGEIVVLREGFTKFQSLYKDDPTLVEKWDEHYWSSEWR